MQNSQIFPTVEEIEQALKKAREPEFFYDSALFPPPPPFPQMPSQPHYQVQPYPQITFKVKTLVYRQLLNQNFPDTPPLPTTIWQPPPNIINNLRNVTVWVEYVGRSLKDEEEFTLYGSEAIKLYKQLPYLNRAICVWSCAPSYAQETEFYLEVVYFGVPKLVANAEQSFRIDHQYRYAITPLKAYSDGYSFFTIPSVNVYPDLLFTYKDNINKYVYLSLNNNSNVPVDVKIANTSYVVQPSSTLQNYTVLKHGEKIHIRSSQPSDFIQGAIFGSIITTSEPLPSASPLYTPVATPTPTVTPKPTSTPTPTPSPSQVHVCMPSVVLTDVKGEPPIYTFNNICGPKGLGLGTYTFLNVPAQYAIGFLNTKDVTVSGTYSLGTHLGPEGGIYEFFFDTVTLNVKKNFEAMSYFSYPSKQYLGGYNGFVFDPECVITPTRTPSATWRPVPLPTPRPTPPPTATLEPYPEVIVVR